MVTTCTAQTITVPLSTTMDFMTEGAQSTKV